MPRREKPTRTEKPPGAYTNLPDEIRRDIIDWIALHPEGPQTITDFLIEAVISKIARDRSQIESLRALRRSVSAPAEPEEIKVEQVKPSSLPPPPKRK